MASLFLIPQEEINTKFLDASDEVSLHEDIVEILFKYKEKICNKFDDVRGMFLIDHFAIHIIDSNNKVMVFSVTPSVEYNLIVQRLWKHDKAFSITYQRDNRFYRWDKGYDKEYFEQIKHCKESKHGFTFGFNLSKRFGSFQLVYSFATRSEITNLLDYYRDYINELFAIGDYIYKFICCIYEENTGKKLGDSLIKNNETNRNISPFLKLIKIKNMRTKNES